MKELLPAWAHPWIELIAPALQITLILLTAWLLRTLLRRLITRAGTHYSLPAELVLGARRVTGFVIYAGAVLLVLDRLGVSGTVLWTAFTGFAAVAAVAFFAAWSVLSNIFCTLLIFTSRPFRLHDHVELLESGDKAGLRGQVVDINLIYTTLQEGAGGSGDTVLQVPNSLFFQRVVRRWRYPPRA
ncbi:MAG: mechanosensitive ion channel family protein [Thauera phenolivorans]|uniref:Small-conductance mechanosensitive channel n=1 Tax=Thauera phenolivorans TaxID=1792543 RepID=A0A7X7R750_9RHOO|nr:mechanosensitive ion channel family protein [Thauera phenolivorans]NLF53800.1 mechanosensitive ion channel family protein [Thauera phenolivorans]